MSEDAKKKLRTQGKYNDKGLKSRDKKHKESPVEKQPPGKKSYSQNRESTGQKSRNSSFTDESENDSPVKYEEKSNCSLNMFHKDIMKPVEIKSKGRTILSTTMHGESIIIHEPHFIDEEEGHELMQILLDSTLWNEKNIVIRNEEHTQPRLVAWYGPFPYSYSGVTLEAAEMPCSVLALKGRIEDYLKMHNIDVTLNSVLLNYYRDGHDSVAWHSDDELSMGICPTIASVSLGATRKFEMKRKMKSEDEISEKDIKQCFIHLTHGSLLIMDGNMQQDWLHRVPKEYHDRPPRINLTFRTVYSLDKNSFANISKDYKVNSVKKSTSCALSDTQININLDEDNFPPLSSSVPFFPSKVDENLQNLPSPINEKSMSMECIDNDNSVNDLSSTIPLKDLDKQKHFSPVDNISNEAMNTENYPEKKQNRLLEQDELMNVSEDSFTSPSKLNADAPEFVPVNSPPSIQQNNFNSFDLKSFLHHYPKIGVKELKEFVCEFRHVIRQNMRIFNGFEEEEFTFLDNLIEENLNERTQILVSDRLHHITFRAYEKYQFNNSPLNKRYSRGMPYSSNHKDSYFNRGQTYKKGEFSGNRQNIRERF